MNTALLSIILVPIVEIYLFIKIGGHIGAFNTILLIFFTAFIGIYYARAQGLSTLNQGIRKLVKNEIPAYEMISGALIAVGAIFLIIPGFGIAGITGGGLILWSIFYMLLGEYPSAQDYSDAYFGLSIMLQSYISLQF